MESYVLVRSQINGTIHDAHIGCAKDEEASEPLA